MIKFDSEEMIQERFSELAEAEGFKTWWECEHRWEDYAELMIAEGLDAEAVGKFFSVLSEDL